MKPLPKEARVQNVTTKPERSKVMCQYCGDDGQVVVEGPMGGYDEAYGPCPFCEAGLRFEYANPTVWQQGFWQGRDVTPDLQPRTFAPLEGPPKWPVYEPKEIPA